MFLSFLDVCIVLSMYGVIVLCQCNVLRGLDIALSKPSLLPFPSTVAHHVTPPPFRRIGVAVDLIEEAAECITSLGNLAAFCVIMAATFVMFSALWLLYTTYLVSSAEVSRWDVDICNPVQINIYITIVI